MQHKPNSTPASIFLQHGFTLVELLIVIVVISILAAITLIAYNGVTERAHTVALQSDLSQNAEKLSIYQAANSSYPANTSDANLQASPDDTFTYNVSSDDTTYCLQAAGWNLTYFITNSDNTPQQGTCDGVSGVPGTGGEDEDGGSAPPTYTVSTFAGNGETGLVNGSSTSAEFDLPAYVAMDSSNNIYVSEINNDVVRKITPSGTVSTYVNTSVGFEWPNGIAFDPSGDLFIADYGNNAVREYNTSHSISTLLDGGAVEGPAALAINSAGTMMYIVNQTNNSVDTYTSTGTFTVLAGNGTVGLVNGAGAQAEFNQPQGIAVDSSGNAYVADTNNNVIRKITPSGTVSTYAGNGTAGHADGAVGSSEFNQPVGIAIDPSGNLYIGDLGDNTIREITSGGVVSTLAGNGTAGAVNGSGSTAEFNQPAGLVLDSSGDIYVADSGNNLIRKLTPN